MSYGCQADTKAPSVLKNPDENEGSVGESSKDNVKIPFIITKASDVFGAGGKRCSTEIGLL